MNKTDDLQRAILNNVPDQAWLKDSECRYVLVNEAFADACGLSEAQILNRTPAEVWPAEWGTKFMDTDREVMRTRRRLRYEEYRPARDGSLRWFDTIKTPILDERGEVAGTVGISRDISARKHAEEELARINRLYAVRSKTNQAIVRLQDRDQLFMQVCEIAVKAGGLELAWIGMLDDEATRPVTLAGRFAGALATRRQWRSRLAPEQDPAFRSGRLQSCRRFVCNGSTRARRFAAHLRSARDLGFASFAVFPLTQEGHRVGIFVLYAAAEDFFTDDIVVLLEALAADLSFSLDFIVEAQRRRRAEQELLESRSQLRELSAYLQTVREKERTRIARELHDELGQALTAIRIGLGVMEAQHAMQQDEWRSNVQALKDIADSTVETVQRIASDLRPSLLDELGLTAAIDWMLESFGARTGIAYEVRLPDAPLAVSTEAGTAIFRILQESLTNISRHSNATQAAVELKLAADTLMLKITDNGRGMERGSMSSDKSLGLIGMRERAYMLGGKLTIRSRKGMGTSIELQLPHGARNEERT